MRAKGTPHKIDDAAPEQVIRTVERFYNESGATISDGDHVCIDVGSSTMGLGLSIEQGPGTIGFPLLGIADEDIPDGEWGDVVTYGVKQDANVATGAAADSRLGASGTAGRLDEVGAGAAFAVCLEAAVANVADVFVGAGQGGGATTATPVSYLDSVTITFGSGSDVVFTPDGSDLVVTAGAGAGDFGLGDTISWFIGAGKDATWTSDGTDVTHDGAGAYIVADSYVWNWGAGKDVVFTPDGTDLVVSQGAGAGDMVFADSMILALGTGKDITFTPGGTNVTLGGSGELLMPDARIEAGTLRDITDPGDAGAISVTNSGVCHLTSAGAETRTMAIPSKLGQQIALICDVYVGNIAVTVASAFNQAGNTVWTANSAGDFISFIAVQVAGALAWRVQGENDGGALS